MATTLVATATIMEELICNCSRLRPTLTTRQLRINFISIYKILSLNRFLGLNSLLVLERIMLLVRLLEFRIT